MAEFQFQFITELEEVVVKYPDVIVRIILEIFNDPWWGEQVLVEEFGVGGCGGEDVVRGAGGEEIAQVDISLEGRGSHDLIWWIEYYIRILEVIYVFIVLYCIYWKRKGLYEINIYIVY